LVLGFPLFAGVISVAALALAAPAIVPYLLVNDQAQFTHSRSEWLAALGASPGMAFILVVVASPQPGEVVVRTTTAPPLGSAEPRSAGACCARRFCC
jgi:hypothetical protein